jgi:hypothetical protein
MLTPCAMRRVARGTWHESGGADHRQRRDIDGLAAADTPQSHLCVHGTRGIRWKRVVWCQLSCRGELSVWGPTKVPHFNRAILAMLDMPEHKIHFIGARCRRRFWHPRGVLLQRFLIPFVAMKIGQPVKWIEDRREHLQASITP